MCAAGWNPGPGPGPGNQHAPAQSGGHQPGLRVLPGGLAAGSLAGLDSGSCSSGREQPRGSAAGSGHRGMTAPSGTVGRGPW